MLSKVVVWEHNSHIGDARATRIGDPGELNLGQLTRERFGDESVLVGFSTYAGTVTAAADWNAPADRKRVRPGIPGSWEALFHEVGLPNFLLPMRGDAHLIEALHFDQTRAVEPLDRTAGWDLGEPPETYPTGL